MHQKNNKSKPRKVLCAKLVNDKPGRRLYYFSYRIATAFIISCFAIVLFSSNKTLAAIQAPCGTTEGYTSELDGQYTTHDDCGKSKIPVLTPAETITSGSSPTASLSIDGQSSVSDNVNAIYGTTTYSSHTITVNVAEASNYSLILSGPTTLSGPSTINATAASGVLGSNLANDTWGYAWENTTVSDEDATYRPLSSSISLIGNALSNKATSFSKKLAFAAKFQNADAGTYHADITISLIVSPDDVETITAVPWDKMVYMQDMNVYACSSVSTGANKTLTDIRDNSTYTIAKLSDGKCWMTQNLRLSLNTLKTTLWDWIRPNDSNVTDYYQLPTSISGSFSNNNATQQIRTSTDNNYGAYYSWCAATAGTCDSATTDGAKASSDICPKGWRLPTGGNGGELQALVAALGLSDSSTIVAPLQESPNNFVEAGYMGTSTGVINSGANAYLWSNTAASTDKAYSLSFGDTGVIKPLHYVSTADSRNLYYGQSIRCIAK